MLQKLAALLGGQQAGQNVQTAQNPQYTNYVREMRAQGAQPLPIQAWMQQQQAAPQPQQAQQQPEAPPKPFQF
jgi:hypothetical protein